MTLCIDLIAPAGHMRRNTVHLPGLQGGGASSDCLTECLIVELQEGASCATLREGAAAASPELMSFSTSPEPPTAGPADLHKRTNGGALIVTDPATPCPLHRDSQGLLIMCLSIY